METESSIVAEVDAIGCKKKGILRCTITVCFPSIVLSFLIFSQFLLDTETTALLSTGIFYSFPGYGGYSSIYLEQSGIFSTQNPSLTSTKIERIIEHPLFCTDPVTVISRWFFQPVFLQSPQC